MHIATYIASDEDFDLMVEFTTQFYPEPLFTSLSANIPFFIYLDSDDWGWDHSFIEEQKYILLPVQDTINLPDTHPEYFI